MFAVIVYVKFLFVCKLRSSNLDFAKTNTHDSPNVGHVEKWRAKRESSKSYYSKQVFSELMLLLLKS